MRKEIISSETEGKSKSVPKHIRLGFWALSLFILILVGLSAYQTLSKLREDRQNQEKFAFDFWNSGEDSVVFNSELTPMKERLIDGILVEQGKENRFPVAVMIENHVDARPQSGLSRASLVYEAPVEGGITRFMAVYADYGMIEKIGPVRSARPYYLDWVKEFDALYLHVGGSSEALEKIVSYEIEDLDQYYLSRFYWRDKARNAPHNVYISGELISRALRDQGLTERIGVFKPWKFGSDTEPRDLSEVPEDLVISFSTPDYEARWKYDPDSNAYLRFQAGKPHLDEEGRRITAKNVVLMYTPIRVIDEEGRRKIKTIGSGKAVLFRAGEFFSGEWRKPTRGTRMRIYVNDEEAVFLPGSTWIEVVSETFDIRY